MITSPVLESLRSVVGTKHVLGGRPSLEVYSYDASLAVSSPDAVVFPGDTAETGAVLEILAQARVPCVPRGFGTNLSGGSTPAKGGVVICLTRMNRILEIDTRSRFATVQPGVTNFELQQALMPLRHYYAPDPASQKVATLGGNIGENSGGPHCLKYGVTTNHVLGLTVVLPGGKTMTVGGPVLDAPGIDVRGLLVGSEGTLAVVTEVVVGILPKAQSVATLLVVYDDVAQAAESVSGIISAGILPATLEMMDSPVIQAVEDSMPCGYPRDAAAVLIIEVDGPATGLRSQAQTITDICRANGCRTVREARDESERDRLWAGRRGAFGAVARITPSFLVTDCTVPRSKLPDALKQVAVVAGKHGLRSGNVFHAGDGNLHPLLFFDARRKEELERVKKAGREIMEACVALGGTITGEHGVGIEKSEAMRMVFSETDLAAQRALKDAFDPDGLLNPGKMFPPPLAATAIDRTETTRPSSGCEAVPATAKEVQDLVRSARVEKRGLVPTGQGTRGCVGNALSRECLTVRSKGLSSVRSFDYVNQVVTVEPGRTLAELQMVLAEHGQWLPIRPPFSGTCTLGGLVALDASGPDRVRYGAARDLLLGLAFVAGTGDLVSAGGQVVKNVAGYDLTRTLAGSLGVLGFLTELKFRTLPKPEGCRTVVASGELGAVARAASKVLESSVEPAFLVAEKRPRSEGAPPAAGIEGSSDDRDGRVPLTAADWVLTVGFEGFKETLDYQAETCRDLLDQGGLAGETGAAYAPGEDLFRDRHNAIYNAPFLLRADLPRSAVDGFEATVREYLPEAQTLLDFGCGRLFAATGDLDGDTWGSLSRVAQLLNGYVRLEAAPDRFVAEHGVFGAPRPEWTLMRKIKQALDPEDVFAPGRLPGANKT